MENDWLKDIVEVGVQLLPSVLRHNVDSLTIRVEPEFGFVGIVVSRDGKRTTAQRFDQFPEVDIKEVTND